VAAHLFKTGRISPQAIFPPQALLFLKGQVYQDPNIEKIKLIFSIFLVTVSGARLSCSALAALFAARAACSFIARSR
jgi:hypothetical protein